MSTIVQQTTTSNTTTNGLNSTQTERNSQNHRRRNPKPKSENTSDAGASVNGAPTPALRDGGRGNGGRRGRGRGRGRGFAVSSRSEDPQAGPSTAVGASDESSGRVSTPTRGGRGGRRGKFNASLTDGPGNKPDHSPRNERSAFTHPSLVAGDLTSTLIDALRTPPYPDCPICFNSIHPSQPSWSCSPSTPAEQDVESGPGSDRCCWTTFHLKCIRSWATKSVKDVADAWRARGEDRPGDWRCPGCQAKRLAVPSGYWCFCGMVVDPKPPRLATPHSCANPCGRARTCSHSCPLPCHPGPCPPCAVTTTVPCHCGKHTRSFRCSNLAPQPNGGQPEMSCAQTCGKKLDCGSHTCPKICHPGSCGSCEVKVTSRCWCGKEERDLGCGKGTPRESVVVSDSGKEERWIGRFECANLCDRFFDCNVHRCIQSCHTPSLRPAPCPRSPSIFTHCPCGKHEILPNSVDFFPRGSKLSRAKCTDDIPTCTSTCMKPLIGCSHVCSSPCHEGPCPPCTIPLVRPCRCGNITRTIQCSQFKTDMDILCDKPCPALRACRRHQCNRLCCPLAGLAAPAKGKKGKKEIRPITAEDDSSGLHECDLLCGKTLTCGNHACEERDHRGACPPCLRSSFEEMICHCARTVLMPPVPCGTRLRCPHPCIRPPPPCGHSRTPHACHDDKTPCPPCPFLTTKQCACGKKPVDNVKCSQQKVSCGQVCGNLLGCGFHKCDRACHGEDCGPCTQVCGKPRKTCLPELHPCTQLCHAPSSCSEVEPCMSTVTLTCPCGRIKQNSPCGRSTSNPLGRAGAVAGSIKCSNECAIAKRNARLAEALGISPDKREAKGVVYSEELMNFVKANNQKFCLLVEKAFADFVTSDKKIQVLPHMPPERRSFVHNLASVYRMDTQMVDQEPQRSVQLIRRIDTRIPTPLLSTACGAPGPSAPTRLGKLSTNLRGSPLPPLAAVHAGAGGGSGRGWTSVVTRPAASNASTGSATPSAPSSSAAATSSSWRKPGPPATARGITLPEIKAAPSAPTPVVNEEDVPDNWEDET